MYCNFFFSLIHVQQGNIEPRLATVTECPIPNLSYSSIAGSCGLPYNNSFRGQKNIKGFCLFVCVCLIDIGFTPLLFGVSLTLLYDHDIFKYF